MSRNFRPGTLRAYALGVFTGSLVTATMTMCAAPAKAQPSSSEVDYYASAVCATLDNGYATLDGVLGIGVAIMEDGYTARDAGAIIAGSVIGTCPQYIPLLKKFVTRYGGANYKTVA